MPDAEQSLAFKYRSSLCVMTLANAKTFKGEKGGYLTAVLYLLPHTLSGGSTLCPYSTPSCREMCLSGSGRSGLPKQMEAKRRRTMLYHDNPLMLIAMIEHDIAKLKKIATKHGLTPAVRLNGTSDILWERELTDGTSIMQRHPELQFYDYSRIPIGLRNPPKNYHLTYSLADQEWSVAVDYLINGQSVAVVQYEQENLQAPDSFLLGNHTIKVINGDEHDLRFLDEPGSLVLLRLKGNKWNEMLRTNSIRSLQSAFSTSGTKTLSSAATLSAGEKSQNRDLLVST